MRVRALGFLVLTIALTCGPLGARTATLAPADETFGRSNLSVLGIANVIRESANRLRTTTDPSDVINGPLASATDALHAWEARYPDDPWIPKNLLALESVYASIASDAGVRLGRATAAWLLADYPTSPYSGRAQAVLAAAAAPAPAVRTASVGPDGPPAPSTAWDRFATLRTGR
jgi:hypothetical protein